MPPTMRLTVATTNAGKVREFKQLLTGTDLEVADISSLSGLPPPEETGRTFTDNAALKASYYALAAKTWTLADDSGLAVNALGGAPGVHSARWAQMHQAGEGDMANNILLLSQMESTPDEDRSARFSCALALSDPKGRIILTTMDWVEGRILRAPRGGGGFGYDPLFFLDSHNKTTAELPAEEKNAISHRGKALRRMVGLMKSHILT